MNFRRRCRGLTPVGLQPSLREAPATAQNEPNRQRIHLAEPKRYPSSVNLSVVDRAGGAPQIIMLTSEYAPSTTASFRPPLAPAVDCRI